MRMEVAVALSGLVLCLGACRSKSGTPQGRAVDPVPKAASSDAAKRATPWNPNRPVDIKALRTRTFFVVAKETSLCPTRREAEARTCGNSVETVSQGTKHRRGDTITVVGDGPVEGQWRAIRYQKAGTLPGWIMAGDVNEIPNTASLTRFESHPALGAAVAGEKLSATEIAALKPGATVSWVRSRSIKFGSANDPQAPIIYVPSKDGHLAVQIAQAGEPTYLNQHGCLVNADCLSLDYVCEPKGYCDEVSLVARVTGKSVKPPEDPEGEWPARGAAMMPLLSFVVIADRMVYLESGK